MSMIDIVAPIEPAPPHVSSRGTSKSAVIVETIRHDGPSGLTEAKSVGSGGLGDELKRAERLRPAVSLLQAAEIVFRTDWSTSSARAR